MFISYFWFFIAHFEIKYFVAVINVYKSFSLQISVTKTLFFILFIFPTFFLFLKTFKGKYEVTVTKNIDHNNQICYTSKRQYRRVATHGIQNGISTLSTPTKKSKIIKAAPYQIFCMSFVVFSDSEYLKWRVCEELKA